MIGLNGLRQLVILYVQQIFGDLVQPSVCYRIFINLVKLDNYIDLFYQQIITKGSVPDELSDLVLCHFSLKFQYIPHIEFIDFNDLTLTPLVKSGLTESIIM